MKTTLLISIFSILSSHFLIAQSDTLSGVLRDSKEKAIKRLKHNTRSKILKSYLGK